MDKMLVCKAVRTDNVFADRMHEGVTGEVNTTDFETVTVFARPDLNLVVRVGELEKGRWDYGYWLMRRGPEELMRPDVYTETGLAVEKLPGEGNGWFGSRLDARAYVCYGLSRIFRQGSPERRRLMDMCMEAQNRGLFD